MKKPLRVCIFLFVFLAALCLVNEIFRWKDYHYQVWPNSATVSGFYRMERGTVDVLFLGSSQGVTAFNPQVLYNERGIRSYNLSTEQQSLVLSYYLLKESLKYQKPKAIVLDVWMCFGNQNPLNSAAGCVRKIFDQMRWGKQKISLINDICALDPTFDKKSFFLKNTVYHERWKSLREADFEFLQLAAPMPLKGYSAESIPYRSDNPQPFDAAQDIDVEPATMQRNMEVYLEKIISLCEREKIRLILCKTPNLGWNLSQHIAAQGMAERHNLPFYDFNEHGVYQESGYNYATDGGSHLDDAGATKVSAFLGKLLSSEYGIEPRTDRQWEDSRSQAEHVSIAMRLPHVTDIYEYLSLLRGADFTVLIAIKDEGTGALFHDERGLARRQRLLHKNKRSGTRQKTARHEYCRL